MVSQILSFSLHLLFLELIDVPYYHTYVHRTFQSRPLRLGWTSKPDVIFYCFGRRNVLSNGRSNWYSVWRPEMNVKWMMKQRKYK
jgi:hypothetical protein